MATTRKGKKILADRAPKIQENRKKSIFIKGRKVSQMQNWVWDELSLFRADELVRYSQHNDVSPFEEISQVEQYCKQNDCSLFTFFSTNKKRKDNIVFGRLFDGHLLDMYEFGITNYRGFQNKDDAGNPLLPQPDISRGTLPGLIFQGPEWESDSEFLPHLRNYFIDFFVGDLRNAPKIDQLEHVIVLSLKTVQNGSGYDAIVYFRHYAVSKPQGGAPPALTQISPSFEMISRRKTLPENAQFETALQKPNGPQKKKNIVKDDLGRDIGRVFVKKPKFGNLRLKRFAGLPKKDEQE